MILLQAFEIDERERAEAAAIDKKLRGDFETVDTKPNPLLPEVCFLASFLGFLRRACAGHCCSAWSCGPWSLLSHRSFTYAQFDWEAPEETRPPEGRIVPENRLSKADRNKQQR